METYLAKNVDAREAYFVVLDSLEPIFQVITSFSDKLCLEAESKVYAYRQWFPLEQRERIWEEKLYISFIEEDIIYVPNPVSVVADLEAGRDFSRTVGSHTLKITQYSE